MLHVITPDTGHPAFATQFAPDRGTGVVVIESDLPMRGGNFNEAFAELDSMDARHRALGFANANGIADARINGNTSGTYAVNKEGIPLDRVTDELGQPLPMVHPRMKVHRYRRNIPVTKRLI